MLHVFVCKKWKLYWLLLEIITPKYVRTNHAKLLVNASVFSEARCYGMNHECLLCVPDLCSILAVPNGVKQGITQTANRLSARVRFRIRFRTVNIFGIFYMEITEFLLFTHREICINSYTITGKSFAMIFMQYLY